MIVVRHETPAAGQQGLNFQPLLLAALRVARAVRVWEAAVLHAKVGVLNRSIFKRLGTERGALEDAAAAHELGANGCVHPRIGSQVESVTKNKALARALADIGNQETGCADFAACGGGRVRKPDQGHSEKAEVGVDE